MCAYLRHVAQSSVWFRSSDLQVMEMLSTLKVHSSCQAERATLLVYAEQVAWVHQQHIRQSLPLERDSLDYRHPTDT